MRKRERMESSSDPYWKLSAEGRRMVNRRLHTRYDAFRAHTVIMFRARVLSPTSRDLNNLARFLESSKYRMRREESIKLLHYAAYMWEQKHGREKKRPSKEGLEQVRGNKYRRLNVQ